MAEMHDSGRTLNELKSGMQKYPQVLVNVKTAKKMTSEAEAMIQKAVKSVEAKLGDKGRVLLRASGTEPLIRVMVEGEDASVVENFAQQLAEEVKKAIGA